MKPRAQSGARSRSSTMPITTSSGTSLPSDMKCAATRPSGVSRRSASRSMSPVEICGMSKRLCSNFACVPLPAPGGPIMTMRMIR
jgi:hypothetical protein